MALVANEERQDKALVMASGKAMGVLKMTDWVSPQEGSCTHLFWNQALMEEQGP